MPRFAEGEGLGGGELRRASGGAPVPLNRSVRPVLGERRWLGSRARDCVKRSSTVSLDLKSKPLKDSKLKSKMVDAGWELFSFDAAASLLDTIYLGYTVYTQLVKVVVALFTVNCC